MKVCTVCKENKDESLFSKNKRIKSGLAAQCKECCARRAREWHQTHKDKALMRNRKWKLEHQEQVKTYRLKWRQDHLEKAKACSLKWYQDHLEQANTARLKWNQEHPERAKATNRKARHERRAKLANSPFPKDFKLMNHCWVCLSTENLTVDHIVPVSRGGTNDIKNLTTLCGRCNQSKNSKTYSEWFEKRLQQARIAS